MEGTAVKAGRIRAKLWPSLGQCGRAGGEKGKMPRIRDHMIFVLYGKAGIHCGDHIRRYAVAATLRRPELDRHFDPLKALSGKHQGERVDEAGGFDARIMGERLRGEYFAVDLLADVA